MKSKLYLLLLFFPLHAIAQEPADSLFRELEQHPADDTAKIALYIKIARSYRQLDLDSALYFSKEALSSSLKQGDKTWVNKSYINLGITYGYMSDYEKAIDCFQQSNSLIPKTERMKIAENYNRIGMCYKGMNDFEKAENSFDQYLTVALDEKDTVNMLQAYLNLGVLYGIQGKTVPALNVLNQALRIAELQNDSVDIANIQHNIANVYITVKAYSKALYYASRALSVLEKTTRNLSIIQLQNTVGTAYIELGDYPHALEYLRKALALAQKIKIYDELHRVSTNLGIVYSRRQQPDSAFLYFNESLTISKELQDTVGIMYNYSNMADLYTRLNNPDKSIFYSKQAMDLAQQFHILQVIAANAGNLYTSYKKKGDLAKALYYHEMNKEYEDSVRSENSFRAAELEQYNFSLERKNSQIALLGKENQIQIKENQIQRNYLLAGGIIGVIILIVSFIYYQQARVRKRLNKTLKKQNDKIQHQAIKLKELNLLKDKVIAVMSHDMKGPITSMYSILQLVSQKRMDPEELPDILGRLSQTANNLSLLVENILGWVNAQMHQQDELKLAPVKLREAGEAVVRLYRPIADQKYITLINLIPEDYVTFSHEGSLSLILRNLVSNAIKFSPETHIVELLAREEDAQITISIKDFGTGMDKEEIDKLFDPHHLYTRLGTNNEKGTGLGLLFVKESIEHLGGTLSINSEKGVGTTFSFSLPFSSPESKIQSVQKAPAILF